MILSKVRGQYYSIQYVSLYKYWHMYFEISKGANSFHGGANAPHAPQEMYSRTCRQLNTIAMGFVLRSLCGLTAPTYPGSHVAVGTLELWQDVGDQHVLQLGLIDSFLQGREE